MFTVLKCLKDGRSEVIRVLKNLDYITKTARMGGFVIFIDADLLLLCIFLFLEGEIFLSKEGDGYSDKSDNHFGWCRIDAAEFDKEF